MAATKVNAKLPARKRKETSKTKAPPPTFKSKEIVSDSDSSDEDTAVQTPAESRTPQGKLKGSAEPLAATKTIGDGKKGDLQESQSSSEVETEGEEEVGETSIKERSSKDGGGPMGEEASTGEAGGVKKPTGVGLAKDKSPTGEDSEEDEDATEEEVEEKLTERTLAEVDGSKQENVSTEEEASDEEAGSTENEEEEKPAEHTPTKEVDSKDMKTATEEGETSEEEEGSTEEEEDEEDDDVRGGKPAGRTSAKEENPRGQKESKGGDSEAEEEYSEDEEYSIEVKSPAEKSLTKETNPKEEGGSTEEEKETSDGSENESEDVASSSTSTNPTQEPAGAPRQVAPAATSQAKKPPYAVAPVSGVKRKAQAELEPDSDDAEEDVEGEADEDGEEESDSKKEDEVMKDVSAVERATSTQAAKRGSAARAFHARKQLKMYQPPTGFEPSSISIEPSSDFFNMLQASGLEGQQIWHITAPAQLPLHALAELSETSLQDGSCIVSHENTDFSLRKDLRPRDAVLLVPSGEKNEYGSSQAPVSAIYHIGQIVRLPILEAASIAKDDSSMAASVTRHQQPAGLKMRFRAFGVSSDSDSDHVVRKKQPAAAPTPPPVFRLPPAAEKSSILKTKKRKSDNTENFSKQSSTARAQKKSTSQPEAQINDSDQMDIDRPQTISQPPERFVPSKKKKRPIEPSVKEPDISSTPESSLSAPQPPAEIDGSDMEVDSPPQAKSIPSEKPLPPGKKKKRKEDSTNPEGEPTSSAKAKDPSATTKPTAQVNASDKIESDVTVKTHGSSDKPKSTKKSKKSELTPKPNSHPIGSDINHPDAPASQISHSPDSSALQSTHTVHGTERLVVNLPETSPSTSENDNEPTKSKNPKSSTKSSSQMNGSNDVAVRSQDSTVSQMEKPTKRKREKPTTNMQAPPKAADPTPTAGSDEKDVFAFAKDEAQVRITSPGNVLTKPNESASTTSKTPAKQKPKKSNPTATPTSKLTNPPPPKNPDAMDIDHPPPAPQPSQSHTETPQKLQQPETTLATTKETPEERLKRKEEKRRQKALRKQQKRSSSPQVNGNPASSPSKTLNSDPPAMPLSEYSARLASTTEKKKPAESDHSIFGPPETIEGGSQSTTGGQSSPPGKKKKKKSVRWSDAELGL